MQLIIHPFCPEMMLLDHDIEHEYHHMDLNEDDPFLVFYPNLNKTRIFSTYRKIFCFYLSISLID